MVSGKIVDTDITVDLRKRIYNNEEVVDNLAIAQQGIRKSINLEICIGPRYSMSIQY